MANKIQSFVDLYCFPPFSTIFATAQLIHLHFIMYADKLSDCSVLNSISFLNNVSFLYWKLKPRKNLSFSVCAEPSFVQFSSVQWTWIFFILCHIFSFGFFFQELVHTSLIYHLLIFVLNISQYKSMCI